MPSKCSWFQCFKCCADSDLCGQNRKSTHLYCGCRERERRKQRERQTRCETSVINNDKQTLMETETESAEDVLQYDFCLDSKVEEWEIDSPTTPIHHQLSSVLQPGADIIIQATVLPNALSFTVNLCMVEKNCIAFHFNPRLDQGYSARNCKLEGKWGNEEGISHQGFPFRRNEPFDLEIFLTHSEFLVAVNGVHYCAFSYRTSLLNINLLEIIGDISVKRVIVKTADKYPAPLIEHTNKISKVMSEPGHVRVTKCAKNTPFIGLLEDPLQSGSQIEISGTVKMLPYVFSVNLQQGSSTYPHPVINLHVSVRFNQLAHAGDHVVLCNAWDHNQGWGEEEFSPTECPFIPGRDFTFRILCREDAFVAWVNEHPLFTFKHRYDYTRIDTLYIQGEIFMNEVKFLL